MFSEAYFKTLDGVLDLEPEDVAALEQRLQADPDDSMARLKLMAYSVRADREGLEQSTRDRWRQFLYLLEHHPESEILGSPYGFFAETELTPAQVQRAGQLWQKAAGAHPSDARLAWNAAQFFRTFDASLQSAYLEEAVASDPQNELYARQLGWLYAQAVVSQVQPHRLSGAPPNLAPLASGKLDATGNAAVLEAAVWLFQSEYNTSVTMGREEKKFSALAQRYLKRAEALDPALDKALVMPQIDPKMAGMLPSGGRSQEAFQRQFDAAAEKIRRLGVEAFPQLPPALADTLLQRGCTVPQPDPAGPPVNVIRGEFFEKGQAGWAVLCSLRGASTILVFRDDRDGAPEALTEAEDRGFLQGGGGGVIEYSRQISPVGRDYIVRHYRAYGGPEPPPIDHQAIDDAFLGKASVVHYRDQGKWLQLQGAD